MNEIYRRTSIRQYKPEAIPRETLEKIVLAGMAAPSACNQQPWEFFVVTERKILDELGTVSPPTAMLKEAAACIICCADPARYIAPDFWQQDLAAATENILLEAVTQGVGACWMGVAPVEERQQKVARMAGIPEQYEIFNMIGLGWPDGDFPPKPDTRFDMSRIHWIE